MTSVHEVLAAASYTVTFHSSPYRHYRIDGEKVGSVTQALGILDKPALVYWAQKTAVEGCCNLALEAREARKRVPWHKPQAVLATLKKAGHGVDDKKAQAAERGLAIHAAWEAWGQEGKVPNPLDFPEEYRGYLRALAGFMLEHRPTFHGSEVIVGSKQHRYGGRFDCFLTVRDETRVGLVDLKTNKKGEVYPTTHGLQLAGYSGAAVEMGFPEPDFLAVLGVGPEGQWKLVETTATPEDFYRLVPVQASLKRIEKEAKAAA